MTRDELRTRLTITVPEAGGLLGIGRDAAYAAAARGDIPTLRLGSRRLVVPVPRLLQMLGATPVDSDAGASTAPATAHNSPSPRSPHDDDDATTPPTASTLRRIHGM